MAMSQSGNERKDEKGSGKGLQGGGGSAANLTEDHPVQTDGKDDAESSEGEELLEDFVVRVGGFESTEVWDDYAVGVEAMAEDGFLDCEFAGGGPYYGAAGERGWVDAFGVVIGVSREQAGE